MRWSSGNWPPSKPAGICAPGLLALGATSGGLATLAANAATDDLLAVRRAFG
jgi:hypothetical protein